MKSPSMLYNTLLGSGHRLQNGISQIERTIYGHVGSKRSKEQRDGMKMLERWYIRKEGIYIIRDYPKTSLKIRIIQIRSSLGFVTPILHVHFDRAIKVNDLHP